MTKLEIVETFERFAASHGYSGIDGPDVLNTFMNERLAAFSRKTRCLYTDSAALTLTIGTGVYDLYGSALTQKVFAPEFVVLDGKPLFDATGRRRGLWSVQELTERYPGYLGAASGRPVLAALVGVKQIRLHPKPDSAYTTYVCGWKLHPDVDWQDDSTALEIPEDYHRAFAAFAASSAVTETSATSSDYERIALIDSYEATNFRDLQEMSMRAALGSGVRGLATRSTRFHRLS